MKRLFCVIAALCLIGSACTSPRDLKVDRGQRAAYTELGQAAENTAVPLSMSVSPERESYRWQADDWQPGQVRSVHEDLIELEPYLAGVGNKPLFLDGKTAVFRGNQRVTRAEIRPGTDVRAYYRQDASGMLRLVSLEILEPVEVDRMRARFETGK